MSKEYFGNLPMLNDGTCSETQSFLITDTQMAIQTEVTLQKDYRNESYNTSFREQISGDSIVFTFLALRKLFFSCEGII